jgi:HK97 family phage major capsid protein
MKWIKYLIAAKGRSAGEIVQIEDTAADTLIENGMAEASNAPAEVSGAAAELKSAFSDIAKAAAGEALAGFRREFAPALKRADLPSGQAEQRPWAVCRRYKTLECFPNTDQGYEKAYRFGMWCLANATKHSQQFHTPWAVEWCRKNGLGFTVDVEADGARTKASRENNNASAGFLVPDEFENDLIELREKYGVFRKYAKKVPMTSDTRSDPRRRGGINAYWVGESQSATYSDKAWDRVRLTAKKLMALTRISNEINEDAVINLGDDYAREIVWAFANKEDQAGFNGDGTSTYGGITGVRQALLSVDATIANILGLRVATGTGYGTSYNSVTLADFNAVVGLLPEFADNDNTAWFVHRTFWGSVMQRLATAAGGNRIEEIVNGARQKTFLGYPVVIAQVMPKTSAVNQIVALLGDLSLAASFGDRRATTLQFSDVADNAFIQDEIVIRGTERVDVNVHDVGESAVATPRDLVMGLTAGPVVGLITASS